jgi:hypothetical protein
MKIQLKKKPRGRPWPKGVSGNSAGRPKGAKNKTTLAMLEGIARAEEILSRGPMLDQRRHYEMWSDCFIQDGIRFRRDTLQRWNPKGPIPARPEKLNNRESRREVILGKKRYFSQRGWLFDPTTRLPVDFKNQ